MVLRVSLVCCLLMACGGGAVVVDTGPREPEPTTHEPTTQERLARRQARHQNTCRRLLGVASGAVRSRSFQVAARAIGELRKRRCPSAQTGAVDTRLALAIHVELTARATPADIRWVALEWEGCLPVRRTVGLCAAKLRSKCPKPTRAGSISKRITAYTRVVLQLSRDTPHLALWIAAQVCLSHTLGITEASAMAQARASEWRDRKNHTALKLCLTNCRLSTAARARLVELDNTFPKVVAPVQKPSARLRGIVAELRAVNNRARRLVRRRPFAKAAARQLIVLGNKLAAEGGALVNSQRSDVPRAMVRRFTSAKRAWQRRHRALRRRLN